VFRRGEARLRLELEGLPQTLREYRGRVLYPAPGFELERAFVSL
jgi:hypothetical protein